jgi:hypothetical protein
MIVKNKWYPYFFIEDGFDAYILKRIDEMKNNLPSLEGMKLSTVFQNKLLGESTVFENLERIILNILIDLVSESKDDNIDLIRFNYMDIDNPKIEEFFKTEEFFKLDPPFFRRLYLDSAQTLDMGMLAKGSSKKWAYYFGEELFYSTQSDEFDLFILENSISDLFKEKIKNYFDDTIIFENKPISHFFKVENKNKKSINEIIYIEK